MMASRVDDLLSSLTPAEVVELRERLGPSCLWCGAPATFRERRGPQRPGEFGYRRALEEVEP